MDLDTPIGKLTVAEFIELQNRVLLSLPKAEENNNEKDERHFVYGLKGLADLLGCSTTTAQKIKSSGKIDQAIFQYGKKIIVDADKALRLLGRK